MDRRLILHDKLKEVLGNNNVYFQPPESVKMKYDAIRYKLSNIDEKRADNSLYTDRLCFEVMLITVSPTSPVIKKLLHSFNHITFVRYYSADNLNHYIYTLYF